MTVTENIGRIDDDPLEMASRFVTLLNSMWMRTYSFAGFGEGVSVHHTCEIERGNAAQISIGKNVYFAPKVWLDVKDGGFSAGSKIVIGDGCAIGRRSTISAKHKIVLESDVLLAPSVLLTDHAQNPNNFNDSDANPGQVVIERNCWLGYGVVVACESGEIRIGRNSIVGANAVVTRSFPPFSIVAGNPAKLIKTYDPEMGAWVKVKKA
ncbi:MAG: acyltransferase [Terriglobales bacterium]|jgi:acetyltransferase-like isoleucine patch superfamily enzyme